MGFAHFIIAGLVGIASTFAYNINHANTSVWLSGAAYCSKAQYDVMKLSGPAEGFHLEDILYDPKTDVQGFTGFLPSQKTAYIAFRGSSSILNWIDDAEFLKTAYPECDCEVHSGFYSATINLQGQVFASIDKIFSKHPVDNVIVSGHSLGAAIAQIMSMELFVKGVKNSVYNFGQPRTGDHEYAAWSNQVGKILWRFTHHRDPVPHLPPTAFDYRHSCVEIYEDAAGTLRTCSSSNCEDPTCADQYSFAKKDASDHSVYLGHVLGCEDSIH